jgi:uncharacterized protein YkuJ
MNFADAMNNESNKTLTENGATALRSTGSAMLDFFATVGALRNTDLNRVTRLFADAYAESPLLATKCLFYGRDVRGGLGERQTFRTLLNYACQHHPECIKPNISLIGLYGRFDDLYSMIGTPLEADMWLYMQSQFFLDEESMKNGKACSLLAKWIKTPDASSPATRKLGIQTALKFGTTVRDFKRRLRKLRKYIGVIESQMSAKTWDQINYETVPSKAMMLYRKAFERNDAKRYAKYLEDVAAGKAKVNASTLYPYDIIGKYLKKFDEYSYLQKKHYDYDALLEEQWKALPNYLSEAANAIVVADTSGSMEWSSGGRPLHTALGLAIYFAEHNTGPYNGLWMSFSDDSRINKLKGETLAQKLQNLDMDHWGGSTNMEAAFMQILQLGIDNHISQEEMVKSIIIISDMEINECGGDWSFYNEMQKRFEANGYKIPNVVYWNVESRKDTFHVDKDRSGVQLCSGQSVVTFKHLMDSINMTPIEMMKMVLESDRYEPITISED